MRADGIVRRFDELGRIVIPKEIRIKLFGTKFTDGEPMEIFMDKDDIIIRKFEENKDDVCEWHKVKNGNAYKCNTHAEIYDSRVLDWCKCPYCGKKIKVVE